MAIVQRYVSPDGELALLIEDVGGGDLAIGFDRFPWHTHADILASMSGTSEQEAVRAFVHDIIDDRSIIVVSTIDGTVRDVSITDDPASEVRYKAQNEVIRFRYWSGREYVYNGVVKP
jgi:hypothetical protein